MPHSTVLTKNSCGCLKKSSCLFCYAPFFTKRAQNTGALPENLLFSFLCVPIDLVHASISRRRNVHRCSCKYIPLCIIEWLGKPRTQVMRGNSRACVMPANFLPAWHDCSIKSIFCDASTSWVIHLTAAMIYHVGYAVVFWFFVTPPTLPLVLLLFPHSNDPPPSCFDNSARGKKLWWQSPLLLRVTGKQANPTAD